MNAAKHLLGEALRIEVLLDSQVYGVPHGQLSQHQLNLLKETSEKILNVIRWFVLHHHLLPTNSRVA